MKTTKAFLNLSFAALSLLVLSPINSFADDSCQEGQVEPDFLSALETFDERDSELSGLNHLSDLVVARATLAASVYTQRKDFTASSCALVEGCINAPGRRRLLRFSTRITNQGRQNFVFGSPTSPSNADNVHYDTCHGHYHVKDWASYELLTPSGSTVLTGRKQAFCLRDGSRVSGSRRGRYTCRYQGITAGWSDQYSSNLTCQWLDITDVLPGRYILQVTVNPTRRYAEENYENNAVRVPVTIR